MFNPLKKHLVFIVFLLGMLVFQTACTEPSPRANASSKEEKTSTPDPGQYRVEEVIDGDTIRLQGLKESVRLLCVDTEEIFKNGNMDEKEFAIQDWPSYLKKKHRKSEFRKYPTPFGEKTREYAEEFFKDVDSVIIENDSPDRMTDFFDRYLCYVTVIKGGKKVNFNVELVRNGYSPYYAKYGYSKLYDANFLAAETEARENNRGVWNAKEKHYPDYDTRVQFWNERGDSIREFEKLYSKDDTYFMILDDTSWKRLNNYIGKEITIFGTLDEFRKSGPPYNIMVSHKVGRSVRLQTDSQKLFNQVLDLYNDEQFFYSTGKLEKDSKGFLMRYKSLKQFKKEPPEINKEQ